MTGFIHETPNLISKNDCLIVIIDMQEKLLPAIAYKEAVTAEVIRLAKFAKIAGLPVIVTEQNKLGATIDPIKNQLPDAVPIGKIHFNCFYNEEFYNEVKRHNKSVLILAGVEAHICVAQTALAAIPEYNVHIISDAIGSRAAENRLIAVNRMVRAGAVISSTEMFIYEILKKGGTEEFKATLPLVK